MRQYGHVLVEDCVYTHQWFIVKWNHAVGITVSGYFLSEFCCRSQYAGEGCEMHETNTLLSLQV